MPFGFDPLASSQPAQGNQQAGPPTSVPGVMADTSFTPQAPPVAATDESQFAPAPATQQAPLDPGTQPNQGQGIPPPYSGPANRGGPVKNALTRMLYGMGQAGLQHVGLPTDYQIQQTQYKQALEAAQLQVSQQHQQLLEHAQQYQQGLDTWVDPRTGYTYQAPPAAMAKIQAAATTGGYRTDVQGLQNQGRMQVAQMRAIIESGQVARLVPGTDESGNFIMTAYNKYNQPVGNVPGALPPASYLNKTSSTVEYKDDGAGGYNILPKTTVSGPVLPGTARARIPTGSPAANAIPGPASTPATSGAPATLPSTAVRKVPGATSPSAYKWMTWTEPGTGRMVAGPAAQGSAAGATDMAQLSGSEQSSVLNARQAYQNYTKIGDPKKPETMGVLQLIDSLDKDGQLGVFASRLNNFMTKNVGASPGDDPRIITLLDKNHLGATKVMLAHIGKARSPEAVNMFLNMANAGTMNGPTLKAGTLAMADYMRDAGMMSSGSPGSTGSQPPAASPTSHIFDSAAWAKANPGKNVDAAKAYAKSQGYEVK
jgi:hypothetical protein